MLLSLVVLSVVAAPNITWRCRNANRSIDVAATLPAVAHTALMAAGILDGDPLYRFNELDWQWVAEEDWTFEGTVFLDASEERGLLLTDSWLTMQGVDGAANVTINGVPVGTAESAFVTWDFAVPKGTLQSGTNIITVAFTAPRKAARAMAAAYPYPVPSSIYYHTWSEPGDMWLYNATCADGPCTPFRNFLRKSPTEYLRILSNAAAPSHQLPPTCSAVLTCCGCRSRAQLWLGLGPLVHAHGPPRAHHATQRSTSGAR